MEKMYIKEVDLQYVIPLRSEVLRPGLSLEKCYFQEDKVSTHLAVLVGSEIMAVVSIFPQPKGQKEVWQLRGMAVSPKQQKNGLGKRLLQAIDTYLLEKNARKIWCNARSEACDFYRKNGYISIGSDFMIEGVGPHYKMEKYYEV